MGDRLFIGGTFTGVDGTSRVRLAALDANEIDTPGRIHPTAPPPSVSGTAR